LRTSARSEIVSGAESMWTEVRGFRDEGQEVSR
jgi:hypothetical protein